ncbi:MAG: hypothetical protein QOH72_3963 [Solirubrobacteraceae bacterium]|jgi:hypothetical protein|nr:hypothetical protein [Solirubrobacteraceae bacterium]
MTATLSAEIAAAIDATRRAGTALVHHPSQPDGPTGQRSRGLHGVADLARCRVALAGGAVIWDGDRHFSRVADDSRLTRLGRGFSEFQEHPLWMLLGGVRWTDVNDRGRADADGHEVRRLAGRVEPPRRPWRRARANVEVWIDTSGLIRIASIQIQPVVIFRDAELAEKVEQLVGTPENPIWKTTELTDFGVAVDIPELPSEDRRRRTTPRTERAPR